MQDAFDTEAERKGRSRDRRRAFLALGPAVVGVAGAVRQPLLVLRARSDGRVS
jgi:hypothetical protein